MTWLVSVAWTNPYKILPEGYLKIKKEWVKNSPNIFESEYDNIRDELNNLSSEEGYNICLSRISENNDLPIKRLSPESLLRMRQKKTINRFRKKAPLFLELLEKEFLNRNWIIEKWHIDLFFNPVIKKKSKLQIEKDKKKKENTLMFKAKKKRKKVLISTGQLNLNDIEINS